MLIFSDALKNICQGQPSRSSRTDNQKKVEHVTKKKIIIPVKT